MTTPASELWTHKAGSEHITDGAGTHVANTKGSTGCANERSIRAACIALRWNAYDSLLAERDALREALKEIVKGEGAFSRDPLTHATNCIDNMKAIARRALKIGGGEGNNLPWLTH